MREHYRNVLGWLLWKEEVVLTHLFSGRVGVMATVVMAACTNGRTVQPAAPVNPESVTQAVGDSTELYIRGTFCSSERFIAESYNTTGRTGFHPIVWNRHSLARLPESVKQFSRTLDNARCAIGALGMYMC